MEKLARGFSNESDYSSPAALGVQGKEVRMAGQERGLPSSAGGESNFYLRGSTNRVSLSVVATNFRSKLC